MVAAGSGFDSRGGQIGHKVANGSPSLRCFFEAVRRRRLAEEVGFPNVTRFEVIVRV